MLPLPLPLEEEKKNVSVGVEASFCDGLGKMPGPPVTFDFKR